MLKAEGITLDDVDLVVRNCYVFPVDDLETRMLSQDVPEVLTDEVHLDAYRRNDGDRCFWCKDALMDAIAPLVASGGEHAGATVVLGVNLDDLGDHRPGQAAASANGSMG